MELLEKTNKIFREKLFELKKKSLTRKAKSGDSFTILLDLIDSLLTSQIQANNVKIILLKDRILNLKNNKSISYNNEKIYTISITFSSFGPFHDDNFVHNFMKEIVNLNFNPIKKCDSSTKEKCNKINKKIKILNKQLLELKETGINLRNYFFDCRFMPISFVYFVLNKSNDITSFLDNLIKNKNILTGDMDIWEQYTLTNNSFYNILNKTNCMHIKSNITK